MLEKCTKLFWSVTFIFWGNLNPLAPSNVMCIFCQEWTEIYGVKNQKVTKIWRINSNKSSKNRTIYRPSCVYTTSDLRRSLNSVPDPGHIFVPKRGFRQQKTALSIIGFEKSKVHHDYKHVWNYILSKEISIRKFRFSGTTWHKSGTKSYNVISRNCWHCKCYRIVLKQRYYALGASFPSM